MRTLLLILSLAVLTGCSSPPSSPLNIAVQNWWPTWAEVFIAQDQGLFTKYGVQVNLLSSPDYPETLQIYKEGKADGVFAVFADVVMLNVEGLATRMVYLSDYSEQGDLLVGQPNLKEVSELKGKTTSFDGFNSFSHFFVLKLLERGGIHEGEFGAANINPTKVLEALETGKIQAGHVYEPAISETLAKGYKVLAKGGDIPFLVTDGLAFRTEVITKRAQEVQGVVKAIVEARAFLHAEPDKGFAILAKGMNLSREEAEVRYKKLPHPLSLEDNVAAFKKGGVLFTMGQEIIDFFYQKGVLVKIPDLNAVIDGQFVTATAKHP